MALISIEVFVILRTDKPAKAGGTNEAKHQWVILRAKVLNIEVTKPARLAHRDRVAF